MTASAQDATAQDSAMQAGAAQDAAPGSAAQAGAAPAVHPTDLGFVATTIWALGVPLDQREALSAAMPDRTLHYITVQQPIGARRAQVMAAPHSCIASWGGAATPDLRQFLAQSGLPFARLGPAHLALRDPADPQRALPMGYYLEPLRGVEAGTAVLQDTARLLKAGTLRQNKALLAAGRQLREAMLRGKVTGGATFSGAPPLPAADGRKTVMVIADDQLPFRPAAERRFQAYNELLDLARNRYSGWRIWFVTNGETDLPATVRRTLTGAADEVLSYRFHPAMLDRADAVLVHEAEAGFDALLRGKRVIAVGNPWYGAGLQADAALLDEMTAARHLFHTRHFDPQGRQPLTAAEAVALISRKALSLPAQRGPEIAPLAPDTPPAPPRTEEDPQQEAEAGGQRKVDPIKVIHASQLDMPDWIAPPTVVPANRGGLVYLPQDLLGIAADLDLPGTPLQIDRAGCGPDAASRARLSGLAHGNPELYRRLVEARLRRLAPQQALLVNLGDPATRRHARICGRLGILRIYLPPQPFGSDPALWPMTAPLVDQARSLFDLALSWEPGHRRCLEAAGFPAARIIDVAAPQPAAPVAERSAITVWLTRPWSSKTDKESIDRFLRRTMRLSELLQMPMRFLFGREIPGKVLNYTLDQITLHPMIDYELEDAELTPRGDLLARSAVVLTDTLAAFAEARNAGAASLLLAHETEGALPLVATSCEAARALIMQAADGLFDMAPLPAPAPGLPTLQAALAALTAGTRPDGSALPAPLGTPLAMLLRGDPVGIITSTLAEADKDKTQRYLVELMGAQKWLRSTYALRDVPDRSLFGARDEVDIAIRWGIRPNTENEHTGAYFERVGAETVYLEDGFLRSIAIGLSGEPTLSLVMDDLTPFYNATMPSRIEATLNAGYRASDAERARARAAIDRIAETKVTKYNFAPYRHVTVGRPGRKKILIVDQRAGDQSISSGLASPESFQRMITEALALVGEYDIIVKTHPDANVGGKASAIGAETLAFLRGNPAVTIVTEDMNGFSLIDQMDKVFVVSSGMGFEALLAGREVWCFGVPFYAGWGLTVDRTKVPRRTARPSLEDVFHLFYIGLSRYYDPVARRRCEIEEMIEHIAEMRPWTMPEPPSAEAAASAPSLPGLGQQVPPSATVWLVGFDAAARRMVDLLLPGRRIEEVAPGATIDRIDEAVQASTNPVFLIWNGATLPGLQRFVKRTSFAVLHLAPGFVQLPGFGQDPEVLPVSYMLPDGAPVADTPPHATLERLLSETDFSPELLAAARGLRGRLLASGLMWQGRAADLPQGAESLPDPAERAVLVLGQPDRPGLPGAAALIALARAENPDSRVIYRAPAGDGGLTADDPLLADQDCDWLPGTVPAATLFPRVSRVYTVDGLDGFEAALRGLPVRVLGQPFYAGWGIEAISEAGKPCKRPRKLGLDALFAGVYMLGQHCLNPGDGTGLTLAALLDQLPPPELQASAPVGLADPVAAPDTAPLA